MSGIDGHGDGSLGGDGNLQLVLVSLGQVNESLVVGADALLVEVALHVAALVGVAVLRVHALVVPDVLEGLVHQAPVAAVVAVLGRAVDEVLLRERDEFTGLPGVLSLKGARRGEGPARSAHSLVLDVGDEALLPPVDRIRHLHVEGSQEFGAVPLDGVSIEAAVAESVQLTVLGEWLKGVYIVEGERGHVPGRRGG